MSAKLLISMVEKAVGANLVAPKSKKSNKSVIIRFGASKPSINIVTKKG